MLQLILNDGSAIDLVEAGITKHFVLHAQTQMHSRPSGI